jgi:hypothetical protein
MSVSGVPSGAPAPGHIPAPARVGHPTAAALPAAAPVRPTREAAPAAEEVPAGSDPALWSILTSEERSFFQRQAALGPITYARARPAPSSDGPIGQRIDLRA